MKLRPLFVAVALAALLTPSPAREARAEDDDAGVVVEDLLLFVGEVRTLDLRNVMRVAVGKGSVLSTKVIEGGQLVLIGEAPGETSLEVWRAPRRSRRWLVRVAPENSVRVLRDVRRYLDGVGGVDARLVADRIVLSGVYDSDDAERVSALKSLFPSVVDLTGLGLNRMVHMDVQILRVSDTLLRDLGVQWSTRSIGGPAGAAAWRVGEYKRSDPAADPRVDEATAAGTESSVFTGLMSLDPRYAIFGIASEISSRINIALDTGRAYLLASPRLRTRSGGKAEFLSGGEIPIITSSFEGTNVEYKEFGLKLEIEPVADDAGNILSQVDVELSALGEEFGSEGFPSFITRRTGSEISVRDGETMAISGLVDIRATRSRAGIWGLSQIPILGWLFRTDGLEKSRDELLVLVTPRIVAMQDPIVGDDLERAEEIREEMAEKFGRSILD